MANTAANVTAGKPAVAGAVFYGATSATLPTDSTTALGSGFSHVGYISDAGVVKGQAIESTAIKAWGGDNVLDADGGKTVTFKFTMIESMNINALKVTHGDTNVSGDLSNGITAMTDSSPMEERAWVIDRVLRGGGTARTVIPRAKVTALDDEAYVDNNAVGLGVTLTCYPDANGKTVYEYMKGA